MVNKIVESVAKVSETVKYAAESVASGVTQEKAQAFAETLKEARETSASAGNVATANANTAWTPPKSWSNNGNGNKGIKFFPNGNPFKKN